MLSDVNEQPDDCHLLAICDVKMADLNYFPESKFKTAMLNEWDNEWEEEES